jgi:hypothetical protein
MDASLGVSSETASAASSICNMRLAPVGQRQLQQRPTCNSTNLQHSAT